MVNKTHEVNALVKLLQPRIATQLHGWRIILTMVGAHCGTTPPDPADLLGFLPDQPLKLTSAEEAKSATALTSSILALVEQQLVSSQPVLTLAKSPPVGRQYALALADGLFGFADGLDFADIDPDALPEDLALTFERLGRRAAATEALGDVLPDTIDEKKVADELLELSTATNRDVGHFYNIMNTSALV